MRYEIDKRTTREVFIKYHKEINLEYYTDNAYEWVQTISYEEYRRPDFLFTIAPKGIFIEDDDDEPVPFNVTYLTDLLFMGKVVMNNDGMLMTITRALTLEFNTMHKEE